MCSASDEPTSRLCESFLRCGKLGSPTSDFEAICCTIAQNSSKIAQRFVHLSYVGVLSWINRQLPVPHLLECPCAGEFFERLYCMCFIHSH